MMRQLNVLHPSSRRLYQNKMKNTLLLLLLLFCHVSSPVKHSLKFFFTVHNEISDLPQFMATLLVDDIQAGYCDSNKKTDIKQDACKKLMDDDPHVLEFYTLDCFERLPKHTESRLYSIMQLFNQSEDVHVLQTVQGCEWNKITGEVIGFFRYGYDGEDLISLDLKNFNWIALKPHAAAIKKKWDTNKDRIEAAENFLSQTCPKWLKKYVNYENSSPLRTGRVDVQCSY
ncbi:hereditary hemochromatosis protein homolog [Anabas testudineus]|uniref:hereditary hemochromatosis protein homolog n=1 Tax=Anabas testudineus TaxID=64144 RepID=UPI00143D868C|nr:hereditary hemochromatosis protein homolog [Anabas testudineus]